ncbi:hypothetical protein SAMN02745194_02890 [Roseomonas rosea]|uniref:Concanavalin A-like lectin/glucanases superfamily protein n=1 Tax=Muricoccus roseus TaxID=198092 RepID=A0A1M6KG63_9PROT|nr:hypothetical protein [Roseomonas rosea]SHJ57976.1 hypothetical protein SAMN02745194_02890 [Roseomonas rosea]
MIGSTPVLHALGSGPIRLVVVGALASSVGFSRGSTGQATTAGGNWQSHAPDVPRFNGAARRLMVEGQRTNGVRNPHFLGAVAGDNTAGNPGTPPANMSMTPGGGLRVVGLGTEDGAGYVDLRVVGSIAGAGSWFFNFDAAGGIAAAAGEVRTVSCEIRALSGSYPAGQIRLQAGYPGSTDQQGPDIRAAIGAAPVRYSFASAAGAGTSSIVPALRFVVGSTPVDITLRLRFPQCEAGAFMSSPILPATGAQGAATRAADLGVFGLPAAHQQRGALVGSFMLPQAASSAAHQTLFALDDGTLNNCFGLRNNAGGLAILPMRVASGAETVGTTVGTIAAGSVFRAAMAWDSSGIAACVNGGAVQTISGANPAVTRLLLGQGRLDLASALFGEIWWLDLHATRLPDATLQTLTNL